MIEVIRSYMDKFLILHGWKKWVFSRTACLGNEIFENSGIEFRWNIQKGRLDLLNRLLEEGSGFTELKPSIFSEDAMYRIVQQERELSWLRFPPPQFIVIDSFADLTDVRFVLEDSSDVYCHYSDLAESFRSIQADGLLELEPYEDLLVRFILNTQAKWGQLEVFYIHYPTHKEQRLEYLMRAERISMATKSVAERFSCFINLEIDVQLANHLDNVADPFPYHYSEGVKAHFREKIEDRINLTRN